MTNKISNTLFSATTSNTNSRLNLDPDAPDDVGEEGEEMDATNDDDAAMMAMMGLSGFGTTKVRKVLPNHRGSVRTHNHRYRTNKLKVIKKVVLR